MMRIAGANRFRAPTLRARALGDIGAYDVYIFSANEEGARAAETFTDACH